jgi:hypothetical protein
MKNNHNWKDRSETKVENHLTLERLVGASFKEEDNE